MTDLLSGAEPPITQADRVRCIERELAMRRRVYRNWVSQKKMDQGTADREIAVMKDILSILKETL